MNTLIASVFTMPRLKRLAIIALALIKLCFMILFWNKSRSWLSGLPSLRSPAPVSRHPQYPPPSRLLDLTDFEYLANPPVCPPEDDVLAVILVHTHPSNTEMRQTTRDHLSKNLLKEIGIRRVFLIGRAVRGQAKYPAVKQEVVAQETGRYQDMVQGNFVEHYRNLTYKHVMGLTWVARYCSQAKFVIKMDDDIAVDIFQIRQMIRFKYADVRNQLLGLMQVDSHPLRTNASKWKVTQNEFKGTIYPSFLSGWCYIAPMDTVQKIVAAAHTFPYFWIDDVLVTGIISEQLGIEREGLNHKYTIHAAHVRCCTEDPYSPQQYYCDYIAGPTGGDYDLLAKALDQFHHCYRKGCERRASSELIARKCVATPKEMPTGRGVGEVIALT